MDTPMFELARVFGSHRISKRKWEVSGYGNVGTPDLTTFAYCEKKPRR